MDRGEVEPVDDRQDFLDHPANLDIFRRVEIVEKLDEFADQAKRTRHELARVGQSYGLVVGIEPRQKQAIGEHLREGVGEFTERQFVKI